jgi:hypothetical protein
MKWKTTGGEPDVVGFDKKTGEFIFYDCSKESPKGRRSLCYDRTALNARKEFKPENSAVDMAAAMGVDLLTEEQYRELQKGWRVRYEDLKLGGHTGLAIRKLGGACLSVIAATTQCFFITTVRTRIMAARGFRGSLRV